MTVKPSGLSSNASFTKYILTADLVSESTIVQFIQPKDNYISAEPLTPGGEGVFGRVRQGTHRGRSGKDLLFTSSSEERQSSQSEVDSAVDIDVHLSSDLLYVCLQGIWRGSDSGVVDEAVEAGHLPTSEAVSKWPKLKYSHINA